MKKLLLVLLLASGFLFYKFYYYPQVVWYKEQYNNCIATEKVLNLPGDIMGCELYYGKKHI